MENLNLGPTEPGAVPAAPRRSGRTRRVAATIAGGAVLAGHPAAAMRLHALCTGPLLRLALVGGEHGQVTFKGKTSPKTIAFERGTVESVTGSAFTVQAPDGTTWTWDLTASTTIHAAGQDTAQAKLATGDRVFVGGPLVSGTRDARLVRIGRGRITGR
jgi:Domain of unknown function (DUF5666)